MEKITYTNQAIIPSGLNYSDFRPTYELSRECESYERKLAMEDMKAFVDGQIMEDFKVFNNCMKQKGLENQRITRIEGKKYPHVTSIITPDTPAIPYIEQHATIGTMLDQVVKDYISTGEWIYGEIKPTPDIKVTFDEVFGLIANWFEQYPEAELKEHSVQCLNKDYVYIGELDCLGTYDGIYTIFDVKKTKTITKQLYIKYFKQMAAYCMTIPQDQRPEAMCIISPFNKPIIETNIEKYFNLFLIDRGKFSERYGI